MDAGAAETTPDLDALVQAACAGHVSDLQELVRRSPDLVRPFHQRMIDEGVWRPEDLYRVMDETTAEYLVRLIEAGAVRPDRLLGLLAAGATGTAVQAMLRWDHHPPAWAAQLQWPVRQYGHIGGWEFDEAKAVRPLTSTAAFALADARPVEPAGLTVSGGVLASRCQWCDQVLWKLLDVDLSTEPLAGLVWPDVGRVAAGTCVRCGCYTTLFTEYDATGSCWWAADNRKPGFLGDADETWELPASPGLRISEPRPTPFSGDAWSRGGSTIGGIPDWIQYPEYPQCPRCGRTMPYLGMITGDDMYNEPAEGCHYLFFDAPCGLTAAVYQQS